MRRGPVLCEKNILIPVPVVIRIGGPAPHKQMRPYPLPGSEFIEHPIAPIQEKLRGLPVTNTVVLAGSVRVYVPIRSKQVQVRIHVHIHEKQPERKR